MSNKLVNLRLSSQLLNEVDSVVKEGIYSSRTEFIKQAIREELSEYKKERLIKSLRKTLGEGKRRGIKVPNEEELEKVREEVWKKLHG